MTNNLSILSTHENELVPNQIPPYFCYRFPEGELDFRVDLKVLHQFFKHYCCSKWINKLEVVNYFHSSDNFQVAMEGAYQACRNSYDSIYFGSFNLAQEESFSQNVLFTAKLRNKQLCCILLGFDSKLVVSNTYKEKFRSKIKSPLFVTITDREKEVLTYIAGGLTTKEIANVLFLSIHTVDSHKQKLYKKLKVRNTAELGKLAERYGLTKELSYQI
jgi:DNA-binding CsgD family transcriptional regulator